MLQDAREMRGADALDFDVAVIGGGMAGLTLADRLRGSRLRVVVLEAGGLDPEYASQRLYAGESVGRPYYGLDRCRFRVLGGSSIRWGGWCRPLDPEDFGPREWMALSGWPIAHQDLAPHYATAAATLGLTTPSFEMDRWRERLPALPAIGAPDFEPALIQHSRRIDFGRRARSTLRDAPDVTVMLHANVVELVMTPGSGRVESARVATPSGGCATVRASTFVLAAGGIENARLMLASRDERSVGIGNESDFVGRCFMEHLHVPSGYIVTPGAATLEPFFRRSVDAGAETRGILVPSSTARAAQALPGVSICVDTVPYVMGPAPMLDWPVGLTSAPLGYYRRGRVEHPAVGDLIKRSIMSGWRLARRLDTVHRARRASPRPRASMLSLYVRGEQTPNPASRVTLTPERDRLGMPRARLDWQVADADIAAISSWMALLNRALRSSGGGYVIAPDGRWQERIVGGPHHMGTTRMSSRPADGVVDRDCRVHTVENLYVAGSSVFTTAGHANPSLTILALALRLADHLRTRR